VEKGSGPAGTTEDMCRNKLRQRAWQRRKFKPSKWQTLMLNIFLQSGPAPHTTRSPASCCAPPVHYCRRSPRRTESVPTLQNLREYLQPEGQDSLKGACQHGGVDRQSRVLHDGGRVCVRSSTVEQDVAEDQCHIGCRHRLPGSPTCPYTGTYSGEGQWSGRNHRRPAQEQATPTSLAET
jgi:hypothetical protein